MLRSLLVSILILVHVACYAAPRNDVAAQKFWSAFRQAVLVNDKQTLISMTKFPFEVHSVDDSLPVKYYGPVDFPVTFNKILSQSEYLLMNGKIVPKTMFGLIYDKKKVTSADLTTPDFFRFYQLEFENVGGKWTFTRAYLEE